MNKSKINYLSNYFNEFIKLLSLNDNIYAQLIEMHNELLKIKKKKKKVMVFGNGGSASIANHFSTDLTKVGKIRCVNCNESNLITCLSNDFGFENWISKSIEYFGDKGDMLILFSSSGNSKNVIKACNQARKSNFSKIITFTGFKPDNRLRKLGDINLWINSRNYNFVENIHQILILSIVDLIKKSKF
jgi:D-sedoheptulose 7-phosphate isomerase